MSSTQYTFSSLHGITLLLTFNNPIPFTTMFLVVGGTCWHICPYIYNNLLEPCEQVGVGTNGIFLGPMLQLNCLPILPLHYSPSKTMSPAAPGRVMASSPHLACTGWSQLDRMRLHACSLTTGLSKGPLDAGIGLIQQHTHIYSRM